MLRFRIVLLCLLPMATGVAQAADSATAAKTVVDKSAGVSPSNDVSPFDKHPECMNRSVDASTGKCIIQDSGTPRHLVPPKVPVKSKPVAASSNATAASISSR